MTGWRWAVAYAGAALASLLLALWSEAGGNVAFVAGAVAILASIGFIGTGGERGARVVRDLFGRPVATEPQDPVKRSRQITLGVRLFLLGLALWAPLVWLAWR